MKNTMEFRENIVHSRPRMSRKRMCTARYLQRLRSGLYCHYLLCGCGEKGRGRGGGGQWVVPSLPRTCEYY